MQRNPHEVRRILAQKLKIYDLKKQYTFDQVLFILDQECESYKCDRDVARQLFDQSVSPSGRTNLNEMIFRYVQNMQTSELCLTREIQGRKIIQEKLGSLKGIKKAYVYLKLIQATVYQRHSSTPALSYKISPSDIPPVTVVNSLNPILNHQFTLELQINTFSIIFFESGVKIAEWSWPDSPQSAKQGEYHRNIMTESISFELKINYKPIGSNSQRRILEQKLADVIKRTQIQNQAYKKLKNFQPFWLQKSKKPGYKVQVDHDASWHFVQKLFVCMPFLRRHIKNLYYFLIFLIALQCLTSLRWPMQFLDITLSFGLIGILYDQTKFDIGLPLLIGMIGFILLIIKTIWGYVINSGELTMFFKILIYVIIILKALGIFLSWIVLVNKDQVSLQRQYTFYHEVDPNLNTKQQNFFKNQQRFDLLH